MCCVNGRFTIYGEVFEVTPKVSSKSSQWPHTVSARFFVFNDLCRVPLVSSVNHVPNLVILVEEDVRFDLLVLSSGQLGACSLGGL